MKDTTLVLTVLFAGIFSSLSAQVFTEKILFNNLQLVPFDMVPTTGGDAYIIATEATGVSANVSVTKTNATGGVLWSKQITNGSITINSISGYMNAANALVVVANVSYSYLDTVGFGLFTFNIDGAGNVSNSKMNVAAFIDDAPYGQMRISPDGAGNVYCSFPFSTTMGIVKLDADQNITWQKVVAPNPNTGKNPAFTVIADNSGVLLTGKEGDTCMFTRLNAAGQVQWIKAFNDNNYRRPIAVTTDAAGNYVIAGMFDLYYPQGLIMVITPSGEVIAEKHYQSPFVGTFSDGLLFSAVERTSKGTYIVVGTETTNYLSMLFELDSAFNFISAYSPGPSYIYTNWGNTLVKSNTPDTYLYCHGNYVDNTLYFSRFTAISQVACPGNSYNFSYDDFGTLPTTLTTLPAPLVIDIGLKSVSFPASSVYGISATLADACSLASGINEPTPATALSVYPNPVTDMLAWKVDPAAKTATVKVFDITGKQLLAEPAPVTVGLNVSSFPAGVYILRTYDEHNHVSGVAKWIKE
jgi:hypothetical protein